VRPRRFLAKFGRIGRAVFERNFSGLPTRGHMLRPVSGWGGQRGALARLVLSGAIVLACADLARAAASQQAASGLSANLSSAQSSPEAAPREPKLAGNASEAYGPEQRAQELYLDAMEKLDAGHDAWAQKTLETLIARFPQSTAAGLARRQLGLLYRHATPPAAPDLNAPIAAAAADTAPPPESVSVGASPVWEQELRRNASIQDRLRNEAGDRVFFSAGSAELGSRARAALTAQAQWLNRWREFEAAIEGHADEPGSEDANLKLSVERAEAVRRRLVEEGVEASRVAIVAQGRAQRIAICTDCSAQNRRAVTLVFASGTRERLGLTAPPPLQALGEPHAPDVVPAAQTVETPAAAEHVGVAR
jgi:peptidoglycan-associated lipoprotein